MNRVLGLGPLGGGVALIAGGLPGPGWCLVAAGCLLLGVAWLGRPDPDEEVP